MQFAWSNGPADEPSLELKGALKALKRSSEDDARIEEFVKQFREDEYTYKVKSNKYGYFAFNEAVDNFATLQAAFESQPDVKQFKLKIEQFNKEKKLNKLTKVFFKNFPVDWNEEKFVEFLKSKVNDIKDLDVKTDVFIAKFKDGAS